MTAAMALLLWAGLLYYHLVRRNIWNPFLPHDQDIAALGSKCLGLAAVLLVGLLLLWEPLARRRRAGAGWPAYRRPFGTVAFGLMVLHALTSLLRTSGDWLLAHWPSILVGALALLAFGIIASHALLHGGARWREAIRRLVYPAFGLAVLHYLLFGKIGDWITWSRTLEPPLPGTSLLVTLLVVIMALIRLALLLLDYARRRRGGMTMP